MNSERIKFRAGQGSVRSDSVYIKEEDSFTNTSNLETSSLVIGHQYLSLEVDCNNNDIIGVSGFFRLDLCDRKTIYNIKSETNKTVKVVSDIKLECGIGYEYIIDGSAIFDAESKILFIGNFYEDVITISIGNNLHVGINDGDIVCIQIENINY